MNQPRLHGLHSGLLQGPRCAPRPGPGLAPHHTEPGAALPRGLPWELPGGRDALARRQGPSAGPPCACREGGAAATGLPGRPFPVAGQSPVPALETRGECPRRTRRVRRIGVCGGNLVGLAGPETCSGAQRFWLCTERRLCSQLCCCGAAGLLLFVAAVGEVSTPRC